MNSTLSTRSKVSADVERLNGDESSQDNKSCTSFHRDCKLKKSFHNNSDKEKNADSDDNDDVSVDNKDNDKEDDMDEKSDNPKVLK